MSKQYVTTANSITLFTDRFNSITNKVGDLALLSNGDSSIVQAINRMDSSAISYALLANADSSGDLVYKRSVQSITGVKTFQAPLKIANNGVVFGKIDSSGSTLDSSSIMIKSILDQNYQGLSGNLTTLTDSLNLTPFALTLLDDDSVGIAQLTLGIDSVDPRGKHTIYIPAGATTGQYSTPPNYTIQEMATNGSMIFGADFDSATVEQSYFPIVMPKSWDGGSLSAQFLWKDVDSTVSGGAVVWGIKSSILSDGYNLDSVLGTQQSVLDSFQASNLLHITTETGQMSPSGSVGTDNLLMLEVSRNSTDATDTYGGDAKLIGIKLIMTTTAATDN